MSRTLWLLFAIFIIYGTTIPFDFSGDRVAITERLASWSWNPLVDADGSRVSIPDAVQNVMLFVPFGVLGAFACRRRFTPGTRCVAVVTLAAVVLSGLVETLQLLTVGRIASSSDLATNTLGGFVGAFAAIYGRDRTLAVLRHHGAADWAASRWAYPAFVALVTLVVAAWQPFDLTLDVGSVASKVRTLLRDPWQAGPLTDEGNAVVLFALSTMAWAAWFDARKVVRAAAMAAVTAAALALGLELSQIFVSSRIPSGQDAAARIAGVAIGVGLWPFLRRGGHAARWLGLLLAATIVSACLSMLNPFTVSEVRQPFSWFPFLGYYTSNWFPIVSHVIEVMLLYFPLGFCLGMTRGKRAGTVIAVVTSLLVATGIEYLQSWVVGRYPDVTDVACSGVGGLLGAWFSTRGAELFERARLTALRRT